MSNELVSNNGKFMNSEKKGRKQNLLSIFAMPQTMHLAACALRTRMANIQIDERF